MAQPNQHDAELAARVAGGDGDALAEVFEAHAGAVYWLANRVLRDKTLAEDVVQDTFIRFWRDAGRFDAGRGSLRTFLLTIAHRRVVDIVRSEAARAQRQLRPPDRDHFDVADEVWSRRVSAEVRRAVEALNHDEKEAISLAYFDGLTYVEVAKHLDAAEGTVKSRIRSGMKKLARTLRELKP